MIPISSPANFLIFCFLPTREDDSLDKMSSKKVTDKGTLNFNGNWAWLQCSLDTILYYHWFLEKKGLSLNLPIWKAHITVVRESDELDTLTLEPYYGKEIEFIYCPEGIGTNGEHWWIEVQCPEIEKIRQEYGLEPQPEYDFHLTIGKEIK